MKGLLLLLHLVSVGAANPILDIAVEFFQRTNAQFMILCRWVVAVDLLETEVLDPLGEVEADPERA